MANMGYCRFENTLSDLEDCYNEIDNSDLSETEIKARAKLITLCKTIAEENT